MSKKIAIAGGTGFVGKFLAKQFGNLGYQVIIISRQKENIQWNKTLMKFFRQTMEVKIVLPSPEWLLEIGAVIIKTEPELILKSRWVVHEKLLESGYVFKYPTLETALKSILNNE